MADFLRGLSQLEAIDTEEGEVLRMIADWIDTKEKPFLQVGDHFTRPKEIRMAAITAESICVFVKGMPHMWTFGNDQPEYHALLQWLRSQSRVLLSGKGEEE